MPVLDWRNRREALGVAAAVPLRTLVEVPGLSFGDSGTENLLIHGNNLDALKALLPFVAGQVKCIYIDPPYNTGSAFEHYDDHLEHSTWLSLMYPRLELLRQFLSEDGSIWISIDDREGAYLQVICDEIFGRQNFVSNISWQRTYSTRNDAKGIVNEVEHILVYSKREGWQPKKITRTAEMDAKFSNPDNDSEGAWTSSDAFAPGAATHQGMVYAVQHPFSGKMVYPTRNRCWALEQPQILEHMQGWADYELREIDDAEERATICGVGMNEVRAGVKAIVLTKSLEESKKSAQAVLERGQWPKFYFTKNGKGGIRRKTYLSAVGDVPPTNLFEYKEVGHTDEAKKEVLKVFDGQSPFATPKPERLIQRILQIATNEGDLVLDSFLGSGTTAAVAHKMGRRWIGVEMGEHARTHCAVRLKKVVEGEQGGISKAVDWHGGGGFHFLELGEVLRDATGAIRTEITWDALAAHLWWTETKTGFWSACPPARDGFLFRDSAAVRSPVLGVHGGVAYALLFNGILKDRRVNGGNVLTRSTLELVKSDLARLHPGETPEKLVVFAEWSRLGPAALDAEKIEFHPTVAALEGTPCN